jgi:uncharacterized protein YecE (DUF72 family)
VLLGWAEQILGWQRQLSSVFVYFDNDQAGFAPENALRLKRSMVTVLGARAA